MYLGGNRRWVPPKLKKRELIESCVMTHAEVIQDLVHVVPKVLLSHRQQIKSIE